MTDMPTMRAAFRTTVSGGGKYEMVFRFPTMDAMHAADDEWRAALPIPEVPASVEPVEAKYLICKGGAYYRPNAQGYTRNRSEAGRYTLEEAISHSYPNGPDGPRDGITYELDTTPSPGFGGGDLREGPAPIPNTRMQCFGCKHLEMADWREPSGDGETFDRGTSADCKAIPGGKNIGVYWSRTNDAPKWCPFLPSLSHDQRGGSGE